MGDTVMAHQQVEAAGTPGKDLEAEDGKGDHDAHWDQPEEQYRLVDGEPGHDLGLLLGNLERSGEKEWHRAQAQEPGLALGLARGAGQVDTSAANGNHDGRTE
jgi:hypothetical protein